MLLIHKCFRGSPFQAAVLHKRHQPPKAKRKSYCSGARPLHQIVWQTSMQENVELPETMRMPGRATRQLGVFCLHQHRRKPVLVASARRSTAKLQPQWLALLAYPRPLDLCDIQQPACGLEKGKRRHSSLLVRHLQLAVQAVTASLTVKTSSRDVIACTCARW